MKPSSGEATMSRSIPAAALALALLAPAAARGGADMPPLEHLALMHVVGTLVAEPDGSASTVQVETRVEAPLKAAIERTISSLHFKPLVTGGQAQRASSAFDLSLAARPSATGKGYDIQIDGIDFRPVKDATLLHSDTEGENYRVMPDGKLKAPIFPREAQRAGAMGRVMVVVHFTPQGKADNAAVVSSMLYDTNVPEGAGRRALAQFERAALDCTRQWRTKVVPGTKRNVGPEGFTAKSTVVFTLTTMNLDADGKWLPVKRLPDRPVPWKSTEPAAADIEDSGGMSSFVALAGDGLRLLRSARGTPVL
jgi:hypothetical protein